MYSYSFYFPVDNGGLLCVVEDVIEKKLPLTLAFATGASQVPPMGGRKSYPLSSRRIVTYHRQVHAQTASISLLLMQTITSYSRMCRRVEVQHLGEESKCQPWTWPATLISLTLCWRMLFSKCQLYMKPLLLFALQSLLSYAVHIESLVLGPIPSGLSDAIVTGSVEELFERQEIMCRQQLPRGRPKMQIMDFQLQKLLQSHFSVVSIAGLFACSTKTIYRRIHEFGLVGALQRDLSDADLD